MIEQTGNSQSWLGSCLKTIDNGYSPFLQALILILFVLLFNYVVKNVLLKLHHQYSQEKKIWQLSLVSALYRPLSYFVWFSALLLAFDILNINLFAIHSFPIILLLNIGAVLALGWFLLRWNKMIISSMMEMSRNKEISWSQSKLDLVSKVGTIVTVVITIVLLMDATGRNMQTLLAFGGISGIALAFASQQFISNFFGGLMVYLTQPFSIGELISIPDHKIEGHVEEIGWYMTKVRDLDKRPIYVPNSIFNQTVVITPSRMTHQHLQLKIGLRYKDIAVVKKVVDDIRNLMMQHPHIDRRMKVDVFFADFGATSLEINVSAYVAAESEISFAEFKQDILLDIASLIAQQGAEIATFNNYE